MDCNGEDSSEEVDYVDAPSTSIVHYLVARPHVNVSYSILEHVSVLLFFATVAVPPMLILIFGLIYIVVLVGTQACLLYAPAILFSLGIINGDLRPNVTNGFQTSGTTTVQSRLGSGISNVGAAY